MDFKKFEEALFNDGEFLKFLPLLMEQNWKKAKPTQRVKIFEEIQRVVSEMDSKYPSLIVTEKFDEDEDQQIVFIEDYTVINRTLFVRTINPYDIISNYFFEFALCDLYERVKEDEEFANSEIGERVLVNCAKSFVGGWDNYYHRKSEKFFLQPIARESAKISRNITLNLLKYMNNEYGMDSYIGSKVSNIMVNSFNEEKLDKDVEENYKVMLDNMALYAHEIEDLEKFNKYVNEIDLDDMSDEQLYALFNIKILNALDHKVCAYFFKKFLERELAGYEKAEALVATCGIGVDEEEQEMFLAINGMRYQIKSFSEGFHYLVCFLANVKLSEGLDTGIEDKQLLEDAKECYDYMFELRDSDGVVECDYLPSGFSYEEYKNAFLKLYYKKIDEAIKKGEFFSDGKPALVCADFSKFEVYLKFAFNMNFEEVKEKQFNILKENYNKKIGGSR